MILKPMVISKYKHTHFAKQIAGDMRVLLARKLPVTMEINYRLCSNMFQHNCSLRLPQFQYNQYLLI